MMNTLANRLQINGQYYEEHSSTFHQVTVTFSHEDDGIRIQSPSLASDKLYQFKQAKTASALGNTPREIRFPDGFLLSFQATQDSDHWMKNHGVSSIIDTLERNARLIIASIIIVPSLLALFFIYVIPAAAIHLAPLVPQSVVAASSRQTLYGLEKTILNPTTLTESQQNTYITNWQQEISSILPNNRPYHFIIKQSEFLGANALALPDGTIIITDDLIKLLQDHPKALTSILLHEIGHVEELHSMRYIAEVIATTVAVNYLFGDISGLLDIFTGSAATVVSNSFSQKLEWEADNYALEQLRKSGRSTEDFALAMELMTLEVDEQALEKLFSTHPLISERVKNAREKRSVD